MTMPDKSLRKNAQTISETITAVLSTSTFTKAAEFLGISRASLYERMDKYPEIREAISKVPQQALERLRVGSHRAAEVLVEQLEDRGNKMEAAKEVLDRVGLTSKASPIAVQVNNNLNTLDFTVDEGGA